MSHKSTKCTNNHFYYQASNDGSINIIICNGSLLFFPFQSINLLRALFASEEQKTVGSWCNRHVCHTCWVCSWRHRHTLPNIQLQCSGPCFPDFDLSIFNKIDHRINFKNKTKSKKNKTGWAIFHLFLFLIFFLLWVGWAFFSLSFFHSIPIYRVHKASSLWVPYTEL